jgi:hypothetical protein
VGSGIRALGHALAANAVVAGSRPLSFGAFAEQADEPAIGSTAAAGMRAYT